MPRLPTALLPDDVREAAMRDLLAGVGGAHAIGPETLLGDYLLDGVRVVVTGSVHGSTRHVAHVDGLAAAVLQTVSRDGVHATIANAFTLPAFRRRGLASLLLRVARARFATVAHSTDLSADGAAFAAATG